MTEEINALDNDAKRADKNISRITRAIVLTIAMIFLVLIFAGLDATAQDSYTVASQLEGQYLIGTEFSKLKSAESFTVTLNAGKTYEIGFEGTNVEFILDDVTFAGEFTSITMTTNKTTTIVIYVEPTSKKNKCGIAIALLQQ